MAHDATHGPIFWELHASPDNESSKGIVVIEGILDN